ncbi:site-specific integrase [Mycobacterium sp. 360MFTsu5.1]|uniref:tyrosine-type recombinase/integrase n=1 Tax=Mycobacterium sp. 360MFTsu5.1 TaxID=1172186 RepID=UPI000364F2FC|nr:site-specific integrase [Mycobacterium sp. 360MFTsu5.1]
MASVRGPRRKDGTGFTVLYQYEGRQCGATVDDRATADEMAADMKAIGVEKAMKVWGIKPTKAAAKRSNAPTVAQWLQKYIDTRTGVTKSTLFDYRSYLKNDIEPVLGSIPVDLLTPEDIAGWVQGLADRKLAGKTIANRHGFLSAALNTAVNARPPVIPHNPALGTRIPRTERKEMCFLTHDEFALLLAGVDDYWKPMVRFMVASGARLGELTALRPTDVDRSRRAVHIGRGWKRTYEKGKLYELGSTKTKKSVRTIIVDKDVLDALDYTGEWLFANPDGSSILHVDWRKQVWYPAVKAAQAAGLQKQPRIHDMRHTCASWMIAGRADMYAVQRHLGHESIQTTINSYTHLDTQQAEAAADIIGKALRPPVG